MRTIIAQFQVFLSSHTIGSMGHSANGVMKHVVQGVRKVYPVKTENMDSLVWRSLGPSSVITNGSHFVIKLECKDGDLESALRLIREQIAAHEADVNADANADALMGVITGVCIRVVLSVVPLPKSDESEQDDAA